ncbi:ABC transporter permease subunit [Kitasatospora viridis]|uniref:ABC-2 family transporter n=1 Tax=Kitasatospora viridis TaxID=281105 RepID=A0A561TT98_9ACTN|nr:ABC transporter permease subunit [Kitasatospora viridis]TWF90346.1 ABC-2 family transporter [Kitasatospora viridis]
MIWLTWRQFRAQALIGLAALLLVAGYLAWLGIQVHDDYRDTLAHCADRASCAGPLGALANRYGTAVDLLGYLLLLVPGLLGVFWGAPLVPRELEAGTQRLVWNQSVTRRRWLAVKLAVPGALAVAVTGAYSLLLSWATGPVTGILSDRFEPVLFASRNLAPLGYAAFAFVLGTACGLLLRRTVPAMAATLVAFAVLQVLVPTVLRPHYQAPVRASVPLTAPLIGGLSMIGTYGDIAGLRVPGGPWVVSTSAILGPDGHEVGHTSWFQNCMNNSSMADLPACLAQGNVHVDITEQPADRYWGFQWTETSIFTALAALLALASFRLIGRRSI